LGREGADKQEFKREKEYRGRPEIDRLELVKLQFENLEEGKVQFRKKLTEAVPSETEQGPYDLHFADQTKETGLDLILGGDGAWPKVRKLVSDQMPEYSGISSVTLTCDDIKADPWLLSYVGKGS